MVFLARQSSLLNSSPALLDTNSLHPILGVCSLRYRFHWHGGWIADERLKLGDFEMSFDGDLRFEVCFGG